MQSSWFQVFLGDTVVSREIENWRRWGGKGGGGWGNKVYFGQCESCESAVKRKAAIKNCQSVANVVIKYSLMAN